MQKRPITFEEIALFIVYRCECGWERDWHGVYLTKCRNCNEPIPEFKGKANEMPERWKKNPKPGKRSIFYVRNNRQLYAWRMLYEKAMNRSIFRYFLYGGAVGGGKSYLIRWAVVGFLIIWFKAFGLTRVEAGIFCEDYPTLKDRHLSKIAGEFPEWLGKFHGDHKEYGLCYVLSPRFGSGIVKFRNLDDPSKYQSSEFAMVAVDELTKNTLDRFNWLRIRNRWPGIERCPFLGATNPGGIGNIWVKQYWIDKIFPLELKKDSKRFYYIPAKATDNPMLSEDYWGDLQSLPEEMRHAMVEGDWQFFIGQAFPELLKEFWPKGHAWDKRNPIPDHWEKFMAMDWNYARPLSLGWYAINDDDLVVRYREYYAMRGNSPGVGMKLTPDKAAEIIKEIEGGEEEPDYRVAGNDIFSPLADGSPPISEQFEDNDIYFSPLDLKGLGTEDKKRTRIFGKMQLHKRLANHTFAVSTACEHWWRTVPNLILDEHNPEDVAHGTKKQEDHAFDETKYALCSRPIFIGEAEKELTLQEKIAAIATGKMDEDEIDDLFVTEDGQAWRDNF